MADSAEKRRKGKPRGKPFAPGNSANPGGRPTLPPEVKEARRLSQKELELSLNRWLFASREACELAAEDQSAPMVDHVVVALLLAATKAGCPTRLDMILNRLIGKVTDVVKLEVEPFVIERPYSGKGQEVLGVNEKTK